MLNKILISADYFLYGYFKIYMKETMFMFEVDFIKDKEEKSFTNKTIMTCLLKVYT